MEKKIVLITGCSSGFGFLISKLLSNKPEYIVYSTMRNLNKKYNLSNEISKINDNIIFFELDVTKPFTIQKAVKEIDLKYGHIDVVVNNAGYGVGGFFEDLSDEEIREQMETNFFGIQNVIREVLPIMHKHKNGKIINISSIAGILSFPGLGAYNASKWAVEGFSESLRLELLPFGIKVCLVEPGSFSTNIFKENAKFAKNYNNHNSKYYKYTQHLIENRLQKLDKIRGNPEKVAKKVVNIIKQKNPSFRNIIGIDAWIGLIGKRLIPHKIFEKIINYAALRLV